MEFAEDSETTPRCAKVICTETAIVYTLYTGPDGIGKVEPTRRKTEKNKKVVKLHEITKKEAGPVKRSRVRDQHCA